MFQEVDIACRLGLGAKMEDLMDTSDLVSDADFLPNAPTPRKPSGRGAPELLSDMSGVFQSLHATYLARTSSAKKNTLGACPTIH